MTDAELKAHEDSNIDGNIIVREKGTFNFMSVPKSMLMGLNENR